MSERAELPEGQVADAASGNWVDHYAPAPARPYLRLSRADRPIGTWLLLIPCWWGLALAVAADPQGAGCTWNDYTDRAFDAQVARTRSRPLPSGQVSPRQALVWMAVQAGLGALVLLTFPPVAIALGVAALLPVLIYPFAKRFTWWPQAFLGIAFNWGALVGWAAHGDNLGWPAVLLWLAGLVWTLFYDTIYAHQDKEDDALIGVKSTARLFGDAATPRWLRRFLVATLALAMLAVVLALRDAPLAAMALALAGVWAFGANLLWQLTRLDTTDTGNCLALFRSNRDAGLILALFLAGAAMV